MSQYDDEHGIGVPCPRCRMPDCVSARGCAKRVKEAKNRALLAVFDEMRAALETLADCRTTYQGYAPGATCLDVAEVARSNPDNYVASYRQELLAGRHLCEHCRGRAVLARAAVVRGGR